MSCQWIFLVSSLIFFFTNVRIGPRPRFNLPCHPKSVGLKSNAANLIVPQLSAGHVEVHGVWVAVRNGT